MGGQPIAATEPTHVLIISHDVVGPRMAGPGIRCRELAQALARHFQVTLAVPGTAGSGAAKSRHLSGAAKSRHLSGEVDPGFWFYDWGQWETLAPAVHQANVVLLSGDVLDAFPALVEIGIPVVVDGYDPHTFETLALFAGSPEQEALHHKRESILQLECRVGDFFVCASERQRDWWLGLLEANGRINVHTYAMDPSLRRLVDVVPFGLPASPLQHQRQVLKGVWPGISPSDKVVLWGGGLWQWLDPLTAIRAMERVRRVRMDVRLVFPGTRHPNSAAVPTMPVYDAARTLAEDMGLLNQCVFFGDWYSVPQQRGWVPYEEWPNYLAESDVGLSLHLNHAETRLAFRSRILDYVWAGLPMVVTEGDATSDLVTQWGLGEIVKYEDVEEVSEALLRLLEAPRCCPVEAPSEREGIPPGWTPSTAAYGTEYQSPGVHDSAFERARASLTWEQAAGPLVKFCRNPQRAPDKVAGYQMKWSDTSSDWYSLAERMSRLRVPPSVGRGQGSFNQELELLRLRSLVQDYEQGRFIRFMRWVRRLWR